MAEETRRGILVGYDGSADADLALDWAIRTAALSGQPVRVVLVEDIDVLVQDAVAQREPQWHDLETSVRARLEAARLPSYDVELARSPEPGRVLESAAATAELAVVGSRGHGAVAEALIGSVSQHLAREAGCPVVVARAAADPGARRIVVGVDGTPLGSAALEFACRRAELTGETVAALYAWRIGDLPLDPHGDMPAGVGREIGDKQELLARAVEDVAKNHPDVAIEQEVAPVAPGQALVDASTTASLVATGSHGRGPLVGSLLGSVSHHVLHKAHCPVAVVR